MALTIRCPDCGSDDIRRWRSVLIASMSLGAEIITDFGAPFLEPVGEELGDTLESYDPAWECADCGREGEQETGEDFITESEDR